MPINRYQHRRLVLTAKIQIALLNEVEHELLRSCLSCVGMQKWDPCRPSSTFLPRIYPSTLGHSMYTTAVLYVPVSTLTGFNDIGDRDKTIPTMKKWMQRALRQSRHSEFLVRAVGNGAHDHDDNYIRTLWAPRMSL